MKDSVVLIAKRIAGGFLQERAKKTYQSIGLMEYVMIMEGGDSTLLF